MDATRFPTLDPELAGLVSALPDITNALDDIESARTMVAGMVGSGADAPGEELLTITDEVLPGTPDVRVRVYRPREPAAELLPGLLDIHGGGFVLGSVEMEHANAVALAARLGVVVMSVEYRLAPEHPYPAGLEDCYLALQHLATRLGVDPTRVAVHGQSAGGGLAAAVALLARDRGRPSLCFQALGIPELDDRLDTPSMHAFTDTPMWSRHQAERSWELYLGGRAADQYAAPARADDLSGLPPAYVVTCELDPLRDEGLTYAMRLLAAGVSTEVHCYPGTFHGTTIVREAAVVKRMEAELFGAWGGRSLSGHPDLDAAAPHLEGTNSTHRSEPDVATRCKAHPVAAGLSRNGVPGADPTALEVHGNGLTSRETANRHRAGCLGAHGPLLQFQVELVSTHHSQDGGRGVVATLLSDGHKVPSLAVPRRNAKPPTRTSAICRQPRLHHPAAKHDRVGPPGTEPVGREPDPPSGQDQLRRRGDWC